MKRNSIFISIFSLIIIISLGVFYKNNGNLNIIHNLYVSSTEAEIRNLWEQKKYNTVIEKSAIFLEKYPFSNIRILEYNAIAWFSLYRYESEKQQYLINTIKQLRKLLLLLSFMETGKVHYMLGISYYLRGTVYYNLSLNHLQHALNSGIVDHNIYSHIAAIYIYMNNYELSNEYLLLAIKYSKNDNFIDRVQYIKNLIMLNKLDESTEELEKLRLLYADTLDINNIEQLQFLQAEIFIGQKRYKDAEVIYNEVIEKNQNSVDAYYYRGELYNNMGQKVRARAEWRKILELDPNHKRAQLQLKSRDGF